jgi:hypothetical protein
MALGSHYILKLVHKSPGVAKLQKVSAMAWAPMIHQKYVFDLNLAVRK